MDVALIEVPIEVAKEQLRSYRKSLHRRADAEYQEIALGLEELAKGTSLVQLGRVFANVSRDAKGRPALAIARADRLRVRWDGDYPDPGDNFHSAYDQRFGPPVRDARVSVAADRLLPRHTSGFALVPIVPPNVRGTLDLSRHFTLWEVERWADNAREVGPDVDPYLLRHISRDLYAVVGSWDLTPLEQAILAGRRGR